MFGNRPRPNAPAPAHELTPPKHLWQFGLRDPAGRYFESICVPLLFDAAYRRFAIDAQSFLGPEYTAVPIDTAHVTLGGVESASVPWKPVPFRAGFADVDASGSRTTASGSSSGKHRLPSLRRHSASPRRRGRTA